ncbi:MAG: hypothetical protein L0191_17230, partial [Acidobacteria bacterium]|nr:hypothetical protein [Acidobacteriota bacterium]
MRVRSSGVVTGEFRGDLPADVNTDDAAPDPQGFVLGSRDSEQDAVELKHPRDVVIGLLSSPVEEATVAEAS